MMDILGGSTYECQMEVSLILPNLLILKLLPDHGITKSDIEQHFINTDTGFWRMIKIYDKF